MIKILTPKDFLFKEIEGNEVVSDIINQLNKSLEIDGIFEQTEYLYTVVTSDELTVRDRFLLKSAFEIFGWGLTLHTKYNDDEKNFYTNILLTLLKNK